MLSTSLAYFWLPVFDMADRYGYVRHAFAGSVFHPPEESTSYCGAVYTLEPSTVSDSDWIQAPTCQGCNTELKRIKGCP